MSSASRASSGAASTRKSCASSLVRTTNQPGPPEAGERWSTVYSMPSRRGSTTLGSASGSSEGMASHSVVLVLCRPISTNAVSRVEPVPSEKRRSVSSKTSTSPPGSCAQLVAPQLEGSLRLVQADVEHEVGRGRPGQAVPRVGHGLGGGGDLGVERAEAQLVLLVAAVVGRVGQPAMVVADRRAADGEVVGALGQRVLVEQDLLLLAGLTGRGQFLAAPGGAPAVDAVVLALLGARVVPPGSPAGRAPTCRFP